MRVSKGTNESKNIHAVQKNSFKLATYNVQGVYRNVIIENIKAMKQQGVKIFCLQEIRYRKGQEFVGDTIKKNLGKDWEFAYFLYKENSQDLGLTIFWDTKVMNVVALKRLALPKLEKLTIFEKIILKIVGAIPEFVQRKALIGTFTIGNSVIRIVNVHLDWQGGLVQRRKQLEFLVDNLNKDLHISSEVICGDFNTIIGLRHVSKERKYIQALLGSKFYDATYHIPWSMDLQRSLYVNRKRLYNTLKKLHINLHQKLDYIWAKGVEIFEVDVVEFEGSDHVPIIATIRLKN